MPATPITIESIKATEAKNKFGELLEKASGNTLVSLMRHGKAAAYVISPEMFHRLERQLGRLADPMAKLDRDFDAMVARMQAPRSAEVAHSLMSIDSATLRTRVRKKGSRSRRG